MAGFDPMAFGSLFWMAMTVLVGIIAGVVGLVHEYVLMPPLARKIRKAKWSKGSPAFIQNDAGRVLFTINDTELPEGVVHNKRGWFLISRQPYIPAPPPPEDGEKGKKNKKRFKLSISEEGVLSTVLAAPVLDGLGKAVFFGYDGSPLLSNLKTLALVGQNVASVETAQKFKEGGILKSIKIAAHADLRIMKEIIPATISRTQLSSLAKWSLQKGYEKKGGDQSKIVVLAICVIGCIAALGIVAWLLTQGEPPAPAAPAATLSFLLSR